MTNKQRLCELLESISYDELAECLEAFPSFRNRLAKALNVKPFAYVSQKSCGCINMCMTSEYAERKFSDDGINDMVSRGFIKPVSMACYNQLRMKCDSCYRK